MVASYGQCLKNHAARFGGHAVDGCGEFIPSSLSPLSGDACGCHRNFHRRDSPSPNIAIATIPTPPASRSPTPSPISASPAPFSYYSAAAPHHIMSLSTARISRHLDDTRRSDQRCPAADRIKKRTRTRFSQEQKSKMRDFAEKLGWRINGSEEKEVKRFCDKVGIDRNVLKVWMHNNKSTYWKKERGMVLVSG